LLLIPEKHERDGGFLDYVELTRSIAAVRSNGWPKAQIIDAYACRPALKQKKNIRNLKDSNPIETFSLRGPLEQRTHCAPTNPMKFLWNHSNFGGIVSSPWN
jgi:hypothetical protein